MLVHRDNDDQSDGDKPVKGHGGTRPHLVSRTSGPVAMSTAQFPGNDDGKAHLIGDALKSVYQRTLEEEIPDDFLNLLKQLK